jgi:glycosyltransferase involved in cell wall biosynthesis
VTTILVSHPHVAAVSLGVAASLESEGLLAAYTTGIAFGADSPLRRPLARLADAYPVLRNRILTGVPAHRVRSHGLVEGALRLGARATRGSPLAISLYNAPFNGHDLAVALAPWPRGTTGVYAYEDGALRTFRRARRNDVARIWDLPLPHHQTIQQILQDEHNRWSAAAVGPPHREPEWKRRRKDGELALATTISVASAFTKRSLEAIGTPQPIVVAPYGFPVSEFRTRTSAPKGPFRVLSVGTHDLRKGTPYLLEAWRQAAIPDAELHLIGPLKLAKPFVDRYAGLFQHWPHVPKSLLGDRYAAADLLAFPTLGDGFGLVIQESMCSGTPVLTTPCGGGPECIADGVEGWIVPPRDVDALVARLREAAGNRDRLHAMGRAARARAERFTWREAGHALIEALGLHGSVPRPEGARCAPST